MAAVRPVWLAGEAVRAGWLVMGRSRSDMAGQTTRNATRASYVRYGWPAGAVLRLIWPAK